ncbi:MAG TPA: cupin domain-containing protein [Dehalococcoidia bacterium]
MTSKGELIVVRGDQTTADTGQTAGMERLAGVAASTTGAGRIWMGRVVGHPGMDSGAHHHGEAESAIYIISGHARVCFGEGYSKCEGVGPGDFVFIPAHLPHIERNVSDEPVVLIVARAPDNIVVNLEDA